MAKVLSRVAVGATVVATVLIGTVSPALADTDKTLSTSHGKMIYHDDGDVFEICDTNADGYGVTGIVEKGKLSETIVLAIDDGGDAGCDKGGVDITNSSDFRMGINWHLNSTWVYSAWFNE